MHSSHLDAAQDPAYRQCALHSALRSLAARYRCAAQPGRQVSVRCTAASAERSGRVASQDRQGPPQAGRLGMWIKRLGSRPTWTKTNQDRLTTPSAVRPVRAFPGYRHHVGDTHNPPGFIPSVHVRILQSRSRPTRTGSRLRRPPGQ